MKNIYRVKMERKMWKAREKKEVSRIKRRAQAHENSSERNPIHTEPTRNLQRNSGLKPSVWLRQHVIQHCVSETGAKHPLHGETLPQYADRAASLSLYVSKSTLTRGHCQIYRDIKRLPLWFFLKNPTLFFFKKPVSLYMCYKFKKKKTLIKLKMLPVMAPLESL